MGVWRDQGGHSDGMGWKPGALGRLERALGLLGRDAGRDGLGKVINPGFQPLALREDPVWFSLI